MCYRRKYRKVFMLMSVFGLCSLSLLYWHLTRGQSDNMGDGVYELIWWTDDMKWSYDEKRYCGTQTCRVTNNRQRLAGARAVLFYGSNMKAHDFPLPRTHRHLWALLHEESPRNVPFVPFDEFLQHFNYSSTFSRHSSLPLTTQYLPHASDLTKRDFLSTFQNKQNVQFNRKLASVVFLQTDCNTMSGREDYVRELMNHMAVDSYGGCLHNRDLPQSLQEDYLNNLYSDSILSFLSDYKFMIAIENGVCEDYITEKFWRPLVAGVVPIYFGSPSIRDWQPQRKSAIYIEDFPNAAALAAHLLQLADNETAYLAYMNHKYNRQRPIDNPKLLQHLLTRGYETSRGQQSEEDMLFHKFECFVCRHAWFEQHPPIDRRHYNCPLPPVHAPLEQLKEPKYAADWRSMIKVGGCQAKLLDSFFRANRVYTKSQFEAKLNEMIDRNLCD